GVQPAVEQHWANTNTYAGFTALPANTDNFTFALANASASAYSITATGQNATLGFVFTIDQNGQRATTSVPSGWTTSASCWVLDKGGKCSE
ncbi:MAG: prepilin-type cleavage/methylation domain-containing protein, partial [Telluria sp.]